MGGKSKAPQTVTTTTSNSAPWIAQQPYLTYGFSEAQRLYNQGGPGYYPGQLAVAPSAYTAQAENAIAARALGGSPLLRQAQAGVSDILGGRYLDQGNPYLASLVGQIDRAVRPSIDANFARSGRYGSGSYARARADSVAGEASKLAFQTYGTERANQMQALGLASGLAGQDYADLGQLYQIGLGQDLRGQSALDAEIQRYQYLQNRPYQALASYMAMIQGNYGGTSSSTQSQPDRSGGFQGGSSFGRALGQFGGNYFGGPVGGQIGGLIGGFLPF